MAQSLFEDVYKRQELFMQRACLIYSDMEIGIYDMTDTSYNRELWLLEDMSFAPVSYTHLHRVGGADGVADGDLADAAHGDDVAGGGLGHRHPAQAVKLIEGGGLGLLRRGVGLVEVAHRDLLVLLYSAPLDAADGDAAHKLVVVNGGDQHLEGGLRVRLRGGDIVEDGLKQGHQVGARHVGGVGGGALAAGAEQGGGCLLYTSRCV